MDTAVRLPLSRTIPSIHYVAEAAQVSRATAWRELPTQTALVHAVVIEALDPIREWDLSRQAVTNMHPERTFSVPESGGCRGQAA